MIDNREFYWLGLLVLLAPTLTGWPLSILIGVQVVLCLVAEFQHRTKKDKP